jgi:hypothetical protein
MIKLTETKTSPCALRKFGVCLFVGAATVLSGCQSSGGAMGSGTGVTASDPTRMTRSGFLSDYARLKPVAAMGSMECWRDPRLDAKQFDKVMVSRMVVSLAPPKDSKDGEQKLIDPSDLKTLTDYFNNALVTALKPQMQVVDQPGPGVVVIRIALTHLVPTGVTQSVVGTLIPYAAIVEAGAGAATGRPAGATTYMGETGMEMQFLDGASAAILAECRDTEVGRKYAADVDAGAAGAAQTWASGYMNSFQSWSYAKNAFDKWALLVAKRLGELRGVTPAK